MRKKERDICALCGKIIETWEKDDFIIAKRILFPDYDGLWEGYQKVRVCHPCIEKFRVYIRKGLNNDSEPEAEEELS